MHAYEIPGMQFSLPAGAAIARRRFVAVNTSSAAVYPAAGASIIGASMDDAAIGQALTVSDGIVIVEAGGVVPAGSLVSTDADGKAIVAAGEATVAGIAITGATATGLFLAVKI